MSEPTLFPTTEWTFVIELMQRGDKAQAQQALARFYERYRPVIAAFFRMHGASEEDAEDLTQDFFQEKIIHQNEGLISRAERGRRFRTFLKKCLEDFWKDDVRRIGAKKRGNYAPHIPMDEIQAANPGLLPSVEAEPGDGYDAAFADRVLALACAPDERKLLQALINETQRRALAAEWDMSEGAVKTALSRFRDRFAVAVRAEVRRTLGPDATDQDVNAEIDLLMKALAKMAVTSPPLPTDKPMTGEQPSPATADGNVPTRPEPGRSGGSADDQGQAS